MLSSFVVLTRKRLPDIWIVYKYSTTVNVKLDPAPLEETSYVRVLQQEWLQAQPFKSMPGPTKFQMIRAFLKGGDFHGKPFDEVMRMCRQRYGNTYLLPGMFGQTKKVITFNVDDFEKVFRTEGQFPTRPSGEVVSHYRLTRKDNLYDEWNLGVAGNGPQWGKFRHAVNPVLMQPKNAVLYMDPLQKVNNQFIQRIRDIRNPASLEVPPDFSCDIHHLAFESIAIVALDKEMGVIRNTGSLAPDAQLLLDTLKKITKSFYDLAIKPSIYKYVKTPTYKGFERSMDTIFDICYKYVEESLQRIEKEGEGSSVLEKLVKIDRKIAIIMAIDMLIGGIENTSSILSAILLCLATHPEKQQKLRGEILREIGRSSNFTVDNMKNLPYLRACIKEAMRLHPVVFGNLRATGMDLSIGGYQVPKGTTVFMVSNLLLREKCYFHSPNEFLPERWLRDSDCLTSRNINPFVFMPFGFGPRSCVGKRIVDLELEITLANIVRNFNMEYNYTTENAFRNYFINTCVLPLKFKFTDLP